MIQSLFILSSSGEVIIEKHWRGLVSRAICNEFWEEVCKASSPQEVLPIITTSKHYLIHVYKNGLFFLCTVHGEVPPLLVVEFLNRTVDIFADYFGEISEDAIKENFVTVYQLLDEMLDNGLPLTTELNTLKAIILPPSLANKIMNSVGGQQLVRPTLPDNTLSSVPWRIPGLKYASNEIYFDMVEEIDATMDANGGVLLCEIAGDLSCTSRLSGMPDLTLSFADPSLLAPISFHPCIRLNRWDSAQTLSFTPPDGQCRLMTYKVRPQRQPPVYVKPQISFTSTSGRVNIAVGVSWDVNKLVEDVVVTIPFPKTVASINLTPTQGTITYDQITKVCKWDVGRVPRDRVPALTGTASLQPGQPPPDTVCTLSLQFRISMFSISGLRIDNLHLSNERYKPYKGVRTLTRAGQFCIRC